MTAEVQKLIDNKLIRDDVPEVQRAPIGPFRQQPAGEGPEETEGKWWFSGGAIAWATGGKPWLHYAVERPGPEDEFVAKFGPQPKTKPEYDRWHESLEKWGKRVAYAAYDWIDDWAMEKALPIWEAWGMGAPILYERPSGLALWFPFAKDLPDYEYSAAMVFDAAYIIEPVEKSVVSYQIAAIQRTGVVPEPLHATVGFLLPALL